MYRRGLTRRQIVELTGTADRTVAYHLAAAKDQDPGLRRYVRMAQSLIPFPPANRQASEATQQVHKLQQQLAALSTDLDAAHAVNRSLMAELNRQERNRART